MRALPPNLSRINLYFRRALGFAQEETIRFRHLQIWPEHILLGLLQSKNSVAEKALSHLGITIESTQKIIAEHTSDLEKIPDEQIAQERNALIKDNPELANLLPKKHYRPRESSAFFDFMKHVNNNIWQKPPEPYCGTELLLRSFMTYPNERIKRILEQLKLTETTVNQTIEVVRDSTQEFKDMQG